MNLFHLWSTAHSIQHKGLLRKETIRERRSWSKRGKNRMEGRKKEKKDRREGIREGERWKGEGKGRGKKEINLIHC